MARSGQVIRTAKTGRLGQSRRAADSDLEAIFALRAALWPDLDRGVQFYTEALSLRVGRRFGGDAIELLGADVPVYLLVKRAGTPPFAGSSALRDYRRHWTPMHLDVAVENLEEAVVRAERAGAKREGAISEHPWGRIALLSDPFGHGFCLLQFKGRGYDEIAT